MVDNGSCVEITGVVAKRVRVSWERDLTSTREIHLESFDTSISMYLVLGDNVVDYALLELYDSSFMEGVLSVGFLIN